METAMTIMRLVWHHHFGNHESRANNKNSLDDSFWQLGTGLFHQSIDYLSHHQQLPPPSTRTYNVARGWPGSKERINTGLHQSQIVQSILTSPTPRGLAMHGRSLRRRWAEES